MDLSPLKEIVKETLSKENIYLDDIAYLQEDNNNYLRITIDKQGGVDIDTCVIATKLINPIVDELDLIEESYILDVTSKERGENNEW